MRARGLLGLPFPSQQHVSQLTHLSSALIALSFCLGFPSLSLPPSMPLAFVWGFCDSVSLFFGPRAMPPLLIRLCAPFSFSISVSLCPCLYRCTCISVWSPTLSLNFFPLFLVLQFSFSNSPLGTLHSECPVRHPGSFPISQPFSGAQALARASCPGESWSLLPVDDVHDVS